MFVRRFAALCAVATTITTSHAGADTAGRIDCWHADEVAAARGVGLSEALEREVAAFRAAGSENDLGRFRPQPAGKAVAGLIDFAPGAAALGVKAGGISQRSPKQCVHARANSRIERRGGVVIEVIALHRFR